jgi:cell division protein FtsB
MIECEFCNSSVSKSNYSKHRKTDLCKNINSIIEKYKNENISKINILNEEVEKYKKDIDNLNNKIFLLETQIRDVSGKQYEYKKNIEKEDTGNKITKYLKHDKFEIDISINEKQLNRTKYKDVPEDVVKKEIQSLKLKDNYQLEYREDDGYINITNLCKAGGKHFKHWNSIDKTKQFLEVLSIEVEKTTSELIKRGSGSNHENSQTWAHPQVAVNIAQWISPKFDVMVSRWVYQIMLTGKFDIGDNKTTKELDEMNKENKLLKNRIKLLESKTLQKQKREVFDNDKNVVYIITTEYKEAQGHYKIGKTQDLQKRLSTYNTSDKHEVIYYTSCKSKKKMDLLEQLVHDKLDDKRIEPNKEWFLSEEEAEDFIKIIDECKNVNKL